MYLTKEKALWRTSELDMNLSMMPLMMAGMPSSTNGRLSAAGPKQQQQQQNPRQRGLLSLTEWGGDEGGE